MPTNSRRTPPPTWFSTPLVSWASMEPHSPPILNDWACLGIEWAREPELSVESTARGVGQIRSPHLRMPVPSRHIMRESESEDSRFIAIPSWMNDFLNAPSPTATTCIKCSGSRLIARERINDRHMHGSSVFIAFPRSVPCDVCSRERYEEMMRRYA